MMKEMWKQAGNYHIMRVHLIPFKDLESSQRKILKRDYNIQINTDLIWNV